MQAALTLFRLEQFRLGITQRDLANRIHRNQAWVSRHLDGTYELSLDDFLRICNGLNMDPVDTLAQVVKQ